MARDKSFFRTFGRFLWLEKLCGGGTAFYHATDYLISNKNERPFSAIAIN